MTIPFVSKPASTQVKKQDTSLLQMYLTTDESSKRDFRQVVAINDVEADFQLYDYVLIEDISDGETSEIRKWIGQITAPNINISPVGGPYDPTILHAIKLRQTKAGVKLAETIESWQITLMGEYRNEKLSTLRRRPKPGAYVRKLPQKETVGVLKLPAYDEANPNAIGYLINVDEVAICVDRRIFSHHILVSGGTGSGKSNTGANLIRQATRQNFTVFLYDAKPDYRKISAQNSDPNVDGTWKAFENYGIFRHGADNVIRVAIYNGPQKDYSSYDMVIGFYASDFEPYMFASLFFDEQSNLNQYEEFASICADKRYGKDGDEESPKHFTMKDVLAEVSERVKSFVEERKKEEEDNKGGGKRKSYSVSTPDNFRRTLHPSTGDAILRKVNRIKAGMKWLDSIGTPIKQGTAVPKVDDPFGEMMSQRPSVANVVAFNTEELLKRCVEGRTTIIHIDCSQEAGFDERTYALFITRFLQINQRYQSQHRNAKNGIVEFVDEAHRLFTNSTRYKEMLTRTFNRTMVEGRSLGHAVIISLQNVSQVPSQLLNNINTHIVMRQNNREVAKDATQTMGDTFADQSLMLGTGEALCKMFESPAVVLARMAPSPYELERSDNAGK